MKSEGSAKRQTKLPRGGFVIKKATPTFRAGNTYLYGLFGVGMCVLRIVKLRR